MIRGEFKGIKSAIFLKQAAFKKYARNSVSLGYLQVQYNLKEFESIRYRKSNTQPKEYNVDS